MTIDFLCANNLFKRGTKSRRRCENQGFNHVGQRLFSAEKSRKKTQSALQKTQ